MNIVFASDQGYIPHLATAIISLILNNPEDRFNIYIINTDIDLKTWEKITALDTRGICFFINLKISDKELDGLILNHHFTKANYYRLFIPELINADRALYIDSDIVVIGPIREMYDLNLNNAFLAAVAEPSFNRHHELEMNPDSKYFNSGVMLLNLDIWRKDLIKDRVIAFVKRKPEVIKNVDQCGLNAIIDGKWKAIHPKYNMQSAFYEKSEGGLDNVFAQGAIKEAIRHPVIVHFTGSSKPWHMQNEHPYKALYWRYRNKTPYRSFFSDDFNLINLVKWITPDFVKRLIKPLLITGSQK